MQHARTYQIQAQLGHSSLAVTSRYLAHVTPEDLAARARRRPSWGSLGAATRPTRPWWPDPDFDSWIAEFMFRSALKVLDLCPMEGEV